MEEPKDILMKALQQFYTDNPTYVQRLTDILEGKSISLRTLDYLVTNYSKMCGVSYIIKDQDTGEEKLFNMHQQYKCQLKSYSKKMFDVFKRRSRIQFTGAKNDETFESTPAQLNFFRWALSNGVVEYGVANAAAIEKHMVQTNAETPKNTRRHTFTPNGALRTTTMRIKVRFA